MPKRRERLNEVDERILLEMEDERGLYIRTIATRLGLLEAQVRRSYRKMKRMGLAYFTTLWDEDQGYPSGSGYILTGKGLDAQAVLRTKA